MAGFLKRFKKKTPEEKFEDEFIKIQLGDKAINMYDTFPDFEHALINKQIQEKVDQNKINGKFIGSKGWFLPDHDQKMNATLESLRKKEIDLNDLSNKWGITAKLCFIGLQDYAKSKKMKEPIFYRKETTIFFANSLKQKWLDLVATIDFDEELNLDNVLERVEINRKYLEFFKKRVLEWVKDKDSPCVVMANGILKRKDDLLELIPEFIHQQWEEKVSQLTYEELANEFGISSEEISEILSKVISENLLENTTNYPVDEMLKPRIQ